MSQELESAGVASASADPESHANPPDPSLPHDLAAPTPVSLYVHAPFCLSKCAYCDFYSLAGRESYFARYVDAVLFEVGHWSHYDLLDDVPTVYFGGGTPTALMGELVRLVEGVLESCGLRPEAEVTVETNPETTDAELVRSLIDAGVNRFSLGVQSFDDDVLRTLGRCHDATGAERAAKVLADAGVPFSLDLMCGVPGQSYASWDASLKRAVATGARHVSVYPLTIEDGTALHAMLDEGRLALPDPDMAADMMLAAEVALAAAGLHRYEVANYARPGYESRHNTVYWTGGAYLGAGPHAASMLPFHLFGRVADGEGWAVPEGPAPSRVRFTREVTLEDYVRHPLGAPEPIEFLSGAEALREDVMLGLRLREGVPVAVVAAAGLDRVLARLEAEGLLRRQAGPNGVEAWATTQQGWLLGNRVFGAVWAAE